MASYRFCRSDDVPLLVQAYEACFHPHFPQLPALTVDGFRRAARRLDLWTSSCVVAFSGAQPIAVLLAAKRPTETLIWALGIHPEHQRHGHGRHLLTSLSQKLAVLGPPRLIAEVPAELTPACALVESCGYRLEDSYVDFARDERPNASVAGAELVVPVSLSELQEAGALASAPPRCWQRDMPSLLRRADELEGLALVGDERIEAWLVRCEREVLAFGTADPARRPLLGTLFAAAGAGPLSIARVSPQEIPFDLLQSWGFRPGGRTQRYTAEARAA
ncbi:MAG TPA: GNAT family N-acetyltransferase [Candidatus Polarisedimenticolaceae bacterium]|nr:GNAT family N-acetyltransferase [Candidatus Polarisedimenticolaceae bacterium]